METQRAIVVTGASTGIGQACALRLDRLGFRVFAAVRKATNGETLKQSASERLTPILIDVTDAASIAAGAKIVGSLVGEAGLFGLVNNAGIAVAGPLEFLALSELRKQFEVNVVGQVAVTQGFLPLLRRGRGRIINIGSIYGKWALPILGPYSASKFAMEAITDALRVELMPWGLWVCIIEPGAVATPMRQKAEAFADANLTKQATDLYGPAIAAIRRLHSRKLSADAVAQTVVHALTAKRPKTRYAVGGDAKLGAVLIRLIPDLIRDAFIRRRLGLSNHPPESV